MRYFIVVFSYSKTETSGFGSIGVKTNGRYVNNKEFRTQMANKLNLSEAAIVILSIAELTKEDYEEFCR